MEQGYMPRLRGIGNGTHNRDVRQNCYWYSIGTLCHAAPLQPGQSALRLLATRAGSCPHYVDAERRTVGDP